MSQLTIAQIPGFFDLADSSIVGGQPLTDDAIAKISHNAKFGTVRAEQFYMGFYQNGNIIPTPTSPVDGYAYSRAECLFFLIHASTLSPAAGFVPGQLLFPTLAANAGTGALLATPYQVYFQGSSGTTPGQVTISNYYSTSGAVNEGTVAVYCLAQRSSVGG
jgi:hypothetical protein